MGRWNGSAWSPTSSGAPSPRSPRSPQPRGRCRRRDRPKLGRSRSPRDGTSSGSSSDPEPISLRLEPIDVGALADGLRADAVTAAVTGRPRVVGDRTRLRQILANLVQNGLRHGSNVPARGAARGTAWSSSTSSTTDRGWTRRVDVFARGSSGAGSSGLGLWLSRSIAEAHGGSLDLVPGSAPGARFRLSLPSASAAG